MHEALFIHAGSALEAIKRKRYFKTDKESNEAFEDYCSRIKLAKAQLAELMIPPTRGWNYQEVHQEIQCDHC
jgi:hypothetical protein